MEFERVYAHPVAEQAAPAEVRGVRPFWIGVRASVVAALGFTLLGLVTAGVLQWELLDPERTLYDETYSRSFELHQVAFLGGSLPLGMGVLSVLALPRALGLPAMRAWWLLYASLALWGLGTLMMLWMLAPVGMQPSNALALGLFIAGLALLAVQVLTTLALHRDQLSRAPFLVLGLGGAAALQLLAFGQSLLQFAGSFLSLPDLGSGVHHLSALSTPITMGLAAHLLEREMGRPFRGRALLGASMLLPSVTPWISAGELWTPVLALGSALSVIWFGLQSTLHLRVGARSQTSGALLLVLLVVLHVLASAFADTLSVDVNLNKTYFVVGGLHLSVLGLFLALVLLAASEPDLLGGRTPRSALLRLGLFSVAIGLGGAFCMMLVLGSQGMPRRYVSYIPQFTAFFRTMAAFAALGLAGVVPLFLAFVRAKRGT